MPNNKTKSSQKPEMTAEEFLRCWIEDKEDITLARQHLRSVIRGKLVEFVNFINNEYCEDIIGNMLDKEDVDKFLSNNQ